MVKDEQYDDDDCDVDGGDVDGDNGMIMAETERASRAARSPPPSETALVAACEVLSCSATHFEEVRHLTRIERVSVPAAPKTRAGPRDAPQASGSSGGGGGGGSSSTRPVAQLSHVFSLQRPIDANARESSFLAYQTVLPLRGGAAGRGGDAQQQRARERRAQGQEDAGRWPADDAQLAAGPERQLRGAVGVGGRRAGRGAPRLWPRVRPGRHRRPPTSPSLWTAPRPSRRPGPFVVTSSTRLLPHALPVRIGAHNLLTTMREFATPRARGRHDPLARAAAGGLAPKRSATRSATSADGVNVWAAWVLLIHMLQRPAPAQARAGLAHHRPRGRRGVPVHQLRARRGDAPRAHGPGEVHDQQAPPA